MLPWTIAPASSPAGTQPPSGSFYPWSCLCSSPASPGQGHSPLAGRWRACPRPHILTRSFSQGGPPLPGPLVLHVLVTPALTRSSGWPLPTCELPQCLSDPRSSTYPSGEHCLDPHPFPQPVWASNSSLRHQPCPAHGRSQRAGVEQKMGCQLSSAHKALALPTRLFRQVLWKSSLTRRMDQMPSLDPQCPGLPPL